MPQIQGVIELVQGHPSSSGGNPRYAVTIAGQEYNTWKPEVARQAMDMQGQMVTAEVAMKPSKDGQFMNYYFNGLVNGAAPVQGEIPMAGGAVPQATTPQIPMQPGLPAASPSSPPIPMAPPPKPDWAREARIVKQSSMASAFNFVGHLFDGAGPEAMEEAEAAAMGLAKRLYVQVLGGPQTLDDEIVEGLVAEPQPPSGDEPETW